MEVSCQLHSTAANFRRNCPPAPHCLLDRKLGGLKSRPGHDRREQLLLRWESDPRICDRPARSAVTAQAKPRRQTNVRGKRTTATSDPQPFPSSLKERKNIDKNFLLAITRLSINPNASGSYQIRDIKHYILTLALSENMSRAQWFCFFWFLASWIPEIHLEIAYWLMAAYLHNSVDNGCWSLSISDIQDVSVIGSTPCSGYCLSSYLQIFIFRSVATVLMAPVTFEYEVSISEIRPAVRPGDVAIWAYT
jgi:hypothetical protein